jgi:hypothetical protein
MSFQSGYLLEKATGTLLVKRVSRLLWNQTFMPYLHGTIIPLDYILSQLNPVHTTNPLCLWSTMIWYWRLLLRFIDKTFGPVSLIATSFNQYDSVCWVGKTARFHITQFSPSSIYFYILIQNFLLKVLWSLITKNI